MHNLRTKISGEGAKKQKGKKAKNVVECAIFAKKVLLLTATPFVNNDMDLRNPLAIVKGKNPLTSNEWVRMYNDPIERERYFRCMFSVYFNEDDDVNFPRRIDHDIEFEMDDEYLREYLSLEDANIDKLVFFDIKNPWIFLSGLRIGLLKIENSKKVKFVINEVINRVNKGKKVIIYSNFVSAGIKTIASYLDKNGIPYYEFTGKTSKSLRTKYVQDYNSGKINVLLITKAAGEGIDLKETNAMFILDPPWNESGLEQAIGRAIRYKSHINLPKEEQYVDVFKLYNIKPINREFEHKSADMIIKGIIDKKTRENKYVIDFLKQYSIENNKC